MTLDLDEVDTREKLVEFIRGFSAENKIIKIENITTVSFLESMAAWIDDMDNYYANNEKQIPGAVSWSFIATLIQAATIYE